MSRMGDALIPPYDVHAIATQALADLGRGASISDVWDLLLDYGLSPFEESWETVINEVIIHVCA